MRLNALFRLAFAPAPHLWLTSPHTVTRWLILQKARHRDPGRNLGDSLTDCVPTVSGTISLPSRGAFHLSLTVLVRYRSPACTQPYEVVLADSRRLSRIRRYLGDNIGVCSCFTYRAITFCGAPFQNASVTQQIGNSVTDLMLCLCVPTTPNWQRHQA